MDFVAMSVSNFHSARTRITLIGILCPFAAFLFACQLPIFASASGLQGTKTKNEAEKVSLRWDPPNVDKPLKSWATSASCSLPTVLARAGARARQLEDNLSNFTADETIQFESFGPIDIPPDTAAGTFQYVAILTPTAWGSSIQETRTPANGTKPFPASGWDTGLPGLALIFLPTLQSDYAMKCEGRAVWDGQSAWLIHFQQRPHVEGHTWSYVGGGGVPHVAKLKGRAWISADSGDVLHLETALMEPVPDIHISESYFSIDYAPVQFHTSKLSVFLPQAVDSYTLFDDLYHHRMIIHHAFSNFMLFSVKVSQEIKKPTQPR